MKLSEYISGYSSPSAKQLRRDRRVINLGHSQNLTGAVLKILEFFASKESKMFPDMFPKDE